MRISAPTSFGILHLQKLIPEYIKKYPGVQVSLSLSDRFIDIVAEGFDVVLRISKLADSSLIARKVAPSKLVMCASPAYLEQYGTPQVPQDLTLLPCLLYSNAPHPNRWQLSGPLGIEAVKVNGPLEADNGDILKSATLAGLGISLLPSFIVGPELCSGKLQAIMSDYAAPEISIYAVFPSRCYLSAKVRTFIDFLTESYAGDPVWDKCD
ncbi:MAG: substrate binding domain-containing protein [Gammaproteobacteria bacterium]|nr:substrate binding domain-containing protein [Gammaproteobacteria bacterium]